MFPHFTLMIASGHQLTMIKPKNTKSELLNANCPCLTFARRIKGVTLVGNSQ